MNWLNLKLCFVLVPLLTPYFVLSEQNVNSNINEEELLPLEQIIASHDVPHQVKEEKKASVQPDTQLQRQYIIPNFGKILGSNTGFQLAPGIVMPAPLFGQPQDAQAASASNKVVLVLNNDKNKPAHESLKRLTRNPDVMDDIVGQFQQLGGDMTQQLLQQFSQTAPDISRTFGQALNEALTQTNLLAQVAPGNFNLSQMTQTLNNQSNLPGSLDLGQLGQSLSQSFFAGATHNVLNPLTGQSGPTDSATPVTEDTSAQTVGATGAAAASEQAQEPNATAPIQNPLDQLVGNPFFPHLPPLPKLNLAPFGMLGPLYAFSPLMPLGSEISEVRVLPEQYSPYKITPKHVEVPTMAEMKLKAALKESLRRKSIPILWFHVPDNHNLQKTNDDVALEAKLKIFEQQVIDELKQLQDLSKMANEVKTAQLQSGVQPTTSLITKLNLFEIPIYDITLGDIEKTLNDEHVKMLLQTIAKQKNQEFHRHQQATTKYLTDLTGAPIKRQTKIGEDTLNNMEKDDIMKMMSYAYRMAALNGHEMPWLKEKASDEKDISKTTMTKQQEQFSDANLQMASERQWLEEKQQQMVIEAEKQRQMHENTQQKMIENQFRHWSDHPMMQQQAPEQRQMIPPQTPEQMQMMPPQMQQQLAEQRQMMFPQMAEQRQMMPPQTQQQMPEQRQIMHLQMPEQTQMMSPQMQQQLPEQKQMTPPQMQEQKMPEQRQMMPPHLHQHMQEQRAVMPPQMQQHMSEQTRMMEQQMQQQMPMIPPQIQQHMPEQRQMAVLQMPEQRQMMSPQMPEENQLVPPQLMQQIPEQSQMMEPQMQQQMQEQRPMMPPQVQQQMPEQRQMTPSQMQQQMPEQRYMPSQMTEQRHMMSPPMLEQREIMPPQMHGQDQQLQRQSIESKMAEQPKALEQRQRVDAETPENTATQNMDINKVPLVGDAKPQMADNEGKARHRGLDDLFGNMDIFGFGKNRPGAVRPPTINNYYCRGCSRYPPIYAPASGYAPHHAYSHAGSYGGAYANRPPLSPPLHKPVFGHYGSGAHGSNAYGSSFAGFRSATGDEEIAAMLQQEQRSPKMMMVMTMMPNKEETTLTTQTKNDKDSAEDLVKNQPKRLAKRHTKSYKESPVAYLIVLRNNKKSKSNKSRRKRSTEYATLQPIDENSLNVLRKTYKNSLKEITLKPNETPAEALMRHNAESVREALDKANKQPMEISAGSEAEEVKENLSTDVEEQQQQNARLPQDYENAQYVSVLNEPETAISNNGPYVHLPGAVQQTPPLYVSFNQPQGATFEPSANPEGIYNNLIPKYNAPGIFSNDKIITQDPSLSMYDSLETVPYIEDYSTAVNGANKAIVYQTSDPSSKSIYNDFLIPATVTPSPAIYKNLQHVPTSGHHLADYNKAKILNYDSYISHVINKNGHVEEGIRQPQVELNKRQRSAGAQESPSLENIMDFIQEQLVQCCNKCKDNILKVLEETFKHKYYGPYSPLTDTTPHILTYRKPGKDEDYEYKQWLMKMSEKGYNTDQLSKQHQKEYLKDGKLNLYIEDKQDPGHEIENIFNKNNQSYKRETIVPEAKFLNEKEAKKATADINNKIENLEEYEEEEMKTENKAIAKPEEQNFYESSIENKSKIKVEEKEKGNKHDVIDNLETSIKGKTQILNEAKTIEATEATTQSAYALRGQFRSHKPNPRPFSLNQGKRFENYKTIDKLGGASGREKSNTEKKFPDENEKLEEILDVLNRKERVKESSVKENSKTIITSTSTNSITEPLKSSANNTTNISKKLSRRKIIRVPSKKEKME